MHSQLHIHIHRGDALFKVRLFKVVLKRWSLIQIVQLEYRGKMDMKHGWILIDEFSIFPMYPKFCNFLSTSCLKQYMSEIHIILRSVIVL